MQVGTIDEIADADRGADAIIGKALQMVYEILAGVVFLGHRPVDIVLKADVAVKIDLRRHHCLASEIDASGSGGDLQLAFAAHTCESAILNQESGILNHAAIARDEPCALENG